MSSGPPGSRTSIASITMTEPSQSLDPPRRVPTLGRQPEELHIPSASQSLGSNAPRSGQFAPPEYSSNLPPSISIQPSAATQQPQYSGSNNAASALPGALQPGHVSRPGLASTNTAPTLPTLPQISTQHPPPSTPKSATVGQPHTYSRSSPAGIDQKYKQQLGNTPDGSRYISPTSANYGAQTPQTTPYSPLGLADIRPHMELGLPDDTTMANTNNGDTMIPTNSNYVAPWALYSLDWCKWTAPPGTNSAGKLAVGSYLEDNHNYIQVLSAQLAQPDPDSFDQTERGLEFTKVAEATHSYPVTRILWEPPSSQKQSTDLLATSGDHLRLWSLPNDPSAHYQMHNSINRSSNGRNQSQKLQPLALLSNSKSPEHTAPITSLDWNIISPSLIITSSIDTTCTIWDIPTLTAKTQLIAHDKEVFDVRFCANSVDVFVSCGADGSVRMFDLRSLEHSTIIYEPSEKNDKLTSPGSQTPPSSGTWPPPLLRIAASPHDAHLLATFSQDSNIIRVLDVRQPGQALLELKGHSGPINSIEWSPSRRGTIASGADDCLVLIWDLLNQNSGIPQPSPQAHHGGSSAPTPAERGPAASWQCDYEISNISWAPQSNGSNGNRNWIGVCGGRGLWGVSI